MKAFSRKLVIKCYHITAVKLAAKIDIASDQLTINALDFQNHNIIALDTAIILPGEDDYIHGVMDIMPIATKVTGELGTGLTHVLSGVKLLITGCDTAGSEYSNFGCSAGQLAKQIVRDRAGTPSSEDILIHINVTFAPNKQSDRLSISRAHQVIDQWVDGIRNVLKQLDPVGFNEKHVYYDRVKPNAQKVAVIKMVGAQGAMHDSYILPREPAGVTGAKSVVDVQGLPIIISPNEYRDGALRALT